MSSKSSSPVKLQKSSSETDPPKQIKAKSEALTKRKPVPVQESSEPDTAKQKERYEKPWLENMAHPAEDKPPKYRKEYQPPPKPAKPEPKPKLTSRSKPPAKEDMKTPKRYSVAVVEQVDKVP
jgi:hypothetical protein